MGREGVVPSLPLPGLPSTARFSPGLGKLVGESIFAMSCQRLFWPQSPQAEFRPHGDFGLLPRGCLAEATSKGRLDMDED